MTLNILKDEKQVTLAQGTITTAGVHYMYEYQIKKECHNK